MNQNQPFVKHYSYYPTTMTIPYSKLESEGEKAQPSAPPDYLMEPGAVHMPSSSYQESNQYTYDSESLLPIATPIAQEDAFKRGDAPMAEVLGFEDKDVRMRFIRKVYGILAVQMALTAAVCTFMIVHKPTQVYVLSHVWPVYTSIGLSFVLLLALMCYKNQRPQQYGVTWCLYICRSLSCWYNHDCVLCEWIQGSRTRSSLSYLCRLCRTDNLYLSKQD